MGKIRKIFDEVPSKYNGLSVFSSVQKDAYYKVLKYRLEKVFVPVCEKLIRN